MPPKSSGSSRSEDRRPLDHARAVADAIGRWYRIHARDLPWRRTRDPYAIWISEIMLQQTQVDRVVGYYRRFLHRFPTVESLAASRWRQLLPLWRGLGYYTRARNLQRAAKMIVAEHRGALPREDWQLRALPGIGPYTAAAIRSFAWGAPVLAIDTNVRRVIGRVFGESVDLSGAETLLKRAAPRRIPMINHALMDLGATICTSRKPECPRCPLQGLCIVGLRGREPVELDGTEHPDQRKKQRKRSTPRSAPIDSSARTARASRATRTDVVAACIHREGLFLLAKRPRSRGGAWEFPGGKREQGEDLRAALKREILEELGIEVSVRPPFHTVNFQKGSRAYRLHFSRCQILRGRPKPQEHSEIRWFTNDELQDVTVAETNRSAIYTLVRGSTGGGRKKIGRA